MIATTQRPPADLFVSLLGPDPSSEEHGVFVRRCLVELVNRGMAPYRAGFAAASLVEAYRQLRDQIRRGWVVLDLEGSPVGRRLTMRITYRSEKP